MSVSRKTNQPSSTTADDDELTEQLQHLTLQKGTPIPINPVLDVSLSSICARIAAGSIKKIIVVTGAGISVSAGIPVGTQTCTYTHNNPLCDDIF